MRSPNLQTLAQAAVGVSALGSGAIMATDAGVSVVAQGHNSAYDSAANLGQTPKEILESHRNVLTSATEDGIAVQSSVLPDISGAGAYLLSAKGSNALNLASGDSTREFANNSTMKSKGFIDNFNEKSNNSASLPTEASSVLSTGVAGLALLHSAHNDAESLSGSMGTLFSSACASANAEKLTLSSSTSVKDALKGKNSDKKLPS